MQDNLAIAAESAVPMQGIKKRLQQSKLVNDIYRFTWPLAKSVVLRKQPSHIYHSPNYYIPPAIKHAVATFHDLSIFHWPQFHPTGRVHLMQHELRNTVKRAQHFITDSEYTRRELSDFFSLDLDRITVAPLACNRSFHPRDEGDVAQVLKQYGLAWREYLLYTGTIEPRKNIITLLRAYDRLEAVEKRHFPLVISGYKGWESRELFSLFERGEREGWLKYLGFVPGRDLPMLYSAARAFVFPSTYEGFGLPALEAMASGTPVICSDASSLPEVVGDCALMHQPDDVDRLCEHLTTLINDNTVHLKLSQQGPVRAQQFSWSHCADRTIAAYKQVAQTL
jgi:alpha-1,3-rhamnosyl/mannosyltransferase